MNAIALLGRKDSPTDGVRDYCCLLKAALDKRDIHLELFEGDWAKSGWLGVWRNLWKSSRDWRGRWVLLQYTALSWSSHAFPIAVPAITALLRRRGARVAVVFHDPSPYPGGRWIDRLRRTVQLGVMRACYRMTQRSIMNVPLHSVRWLPRDPHKAVFIPIGSNIPECEPKNASHRETKTLAVFGITGGAAQTQEVQDIAGVAYSLAQQLGSVRVRLLLVGRGTEEARPALEGMLHPGGIELCIRGVLPAEQVAEELAGADVFLAVRGELTTQRGSSLAAIACGLPIVAYGQAFPGSPLAEAGVEFVPYGDRDGLARAALRVLNDDGLRAEMRRKNRLVMRKYFSWDAVAESYAKILLDPSFAPAASDD